MQKTNNTIPPNLEPISLRGSGAFGYVLEAQDHNLGQKVAIKRTHKVGTLLSREHQILSDLKGKENIIGLHDTFYSVDKDGNMVQNCMFEFAEKSMENYLKEFRHAKKLIPIEKIKNIVHRDLKPENILLTDDDRIKICDFGSSKYIYDTTKSTPYITSRFYRAPELLLACTTYDSKIDIFSIGCILAELFTLKPIFPGKSEGMQIFEYIATLGKPSKKYFQQFNLEKDILAMLNGLKENRPYDLALILNPSGFYEKKDVDLAVDLLKNLIHWDPKCRYTAEEALKHDFLK